MGRLSQPAGTLPWIGHRGAVSPTSNQHSGERREDLPVFARWPGDRTTQPGVELGSDLFADGPRVFIPGGDPGRGESQGAVISGLEHDDTGLLCRCIEGGDRSIWRARDR